MSRRVRLRLKGMQFVRCECAEDLDRGPEERALVVDVRVFDNAVALAETAGWRVPGSSLKCRHLSRAGVAALVRHLREALANEPPELLGRKNRFSTEAQLRSFFAMPVNQRAVMKLLALLEQGGELTVEDA